MKKKPIFTTKELINATKGWNGGAGLIVPTQIAKILRSMGITSGYTESKQIRG